MSLIIESFECECTDVHLKLVKYVLKCVWKSRKGYRGSLVGLSIDSKMNQSTNEQRRDQQRHCCRQVGFCGFMGADFSEFQGVLRFTLEILLAETLMIYKMQPSTKDRLQEHKGRTE